MGDWIFTTLTWLLLALGIPGLAWTMLWDRSRGRRRCPKCWYVVDGVPETDSAVTCPECGKVVRKPRKLRKTRRRWGWAALAVLLLAGSYASHAYPIVRDHGWWRASPDIVLIAMLPHHDAFRNRPGASISNPYLSEVRFRSSRSAWDDDRGGWTRGGLWPWERWLLAPRAAAMLADQRSPQEARQAAWLLALATDAPLSYARERDRAMVIIAEASRRYESCDWYADYGWERPAPAEDGTPSTFRMLWATAFRRDGPARYEQRHVSTGQPEFLAVEIGWRDERGLFWRYASYADQPQPEKAEDFGDAALGGRRPALRDLLPETMSLDHLSDRSWSNPVYVGTAEDRGRTVHIVRVNMYNRDPRNVLELWFDAEHFLLRRKLSPRFGDIVYWPFIGDEARALLLGSEIAQPWWSGDAGDLTATQLAVMMRRFDAEHAGVYGHAILHPDAIAHPP